MEDRKDLDLRPQETDFLQKLRRACSRIGWALVAYYLASTLIGAGLQTAAVLVPGFGDGGWLMWVAGFAPQYLVGLPLALVVLRSVPGEKPEDHSLSFGQFMIVFIMCFCLMYGGNLIGNILAALFSGGQAANPLESMAMDNSPLKILFMVILAPLVEELVFRKVIIDRTAAFGEKRAVFLSALLFALFHMNLYQFFYAFALGWLFGYVYLRTARLRYTVILHAIVNFIGSVLGPMVLEAAERMARFGEIDPAAMTEELAMEMMALLPSLLGMWLYVLAILGLSVAGLVLILVNRKKLLWKTAPMEPEQGTGKAMYCNAGMIVFFILCGVMTVLTLFLI